MPSAAEALVSSERPPGRKIAESAREDGTSELLVMTTNDDARSS